MCQQLQDPSLQGWILNRKLLVLAQNKSTIPNSTPRRSLAIWHNWPTRVILKAVFLTVTAKTSNFRLELSQLHVFNAGLKLTLITTSASTNTVEKAPAINGYLQPHWQKTTEFTGPIGSAWEASLMIRPHVHVLLYGIPVRIWTNVDRRTDKISLNSARGIRW